MKTTSILCSLLLAQAAVAQQSTLGEGDSYAWAVNIGWLDLRPNRPSVGDGARVADTILSGFGWSDSTGWINFGDGSPTNGIQYNNSDGADSGVNLDGLGNLSGLAWSRNLGWINFGWAGPENVNRPRIELQTGALLGYAWCPTVGWITLDTGLLKTDSIAITDTDNDGISDAWEINIVESLNGLSDTGDADGDGVSDLEEYHADTNPLDAGDILDITQFIPGNTSSQLTWTSRPTRHYRVKLSQTLTSWSDSPLGLILPDVGASTSRVPTHSNQVRWFFQVEPIIPLQP